MLPQPTCSSASAQGMPLNLSPAALSASVQSSSSLELLAGLEIRPAAASPLPTQPFCSPIQAGGTGLNKTGPAPSNIVAGGAATTGSPVPPLPRLEERRGSGGAAKDVERLRAETEKLEHLVGGLTSRSLQGTVPLDTKWRDLLKLPEQSGNERRFSGFLTGLRIRILIGSGPDSESGSRPGSKRAKKTNKSRKNEEISCFEVLDVLF